MSRFALPHQLVGLLVIIQIRLKQHFRRVFRGNFRPEVVSDVMSGVVVDPTGLKFRVQFGDSIKGQTVLEI